MGGTTVEHRITRSTDASRENDYNNCLYACRLCNRSRGSWPLAYRGAHLLDPTQAPWSGHFEASDDRLRPLEGDADAQYTHRVYRLDDARKIERRLVRRELLTDRLLLAAQLQGRIARMLRLADRLRKTDLLGFGQVLQMIKQLRADALRTWGDLTRYSAIPADAPLSCRCSPPEEHFLPDELERQTIEVTEGIIT